MTIYRFNFSEDFSNDLCSFAKVNQFLSRPDFKEKWEEWVIEKNEKIQEEIRRLESLGYTGDIQTKMFKSARYYFRTKTSKEPKKRRIYSSQNKDLLKEIDDFIAADMKREGFTPKSSFILWHGDDIEKENMKKMFKNRYFLAKNK
jgi:hypothetical protein